MSFFDKVKEAAMNQFIEVIEWLDNSGDTILYRFPVYQQEIKNGAQLIVRESQAAVFVFEGQAADTFGPGRYTIDGGNTPILSKLGAWKHGFNSPMKSEVYFVNTKQFTDMKWGTSNPIMLRDNDFGIVRLRAFGGYSMRVADPQTFIKEVAGTNAHFQTEDIDEQLKRAIVTEFSDAIGEMKIPALDLAAQYKEVGDVIRGKINEDFRTYGLEVTKFYVENVSLPPEVEAAIDKRSSMGALGDANRYMQFQAADALRDAAQNEGGGAGLGAGLGAGFAAIRWRMFSASKDSRKAAAADRNHKPSRVRIAGNRTSPARNSAAIAAGRWTLPKSPASNAARSFAKALNSVPNAAHRRKNKNAPTVRLTSTRAQSSATNAAQRSKAKNKFFLNLQD
jgi:membrane protease subunit (stomatin/prohibitin family)